MFKGKNIKQHNLAQKEKAKKFLISKDMLNKINVKEELKKIETAINQTRANATKNANNLQEDGENSNTNPFSRGNSNPNNYPSNTSSYSSANYNRNATQYSTASNNNRNI